MAETVTITTFLELKDNMSAGLSKVEAALKNIGGAQAAQSKVDRAQAKAQKEKTKETEKAAQAQAKAQKEAERAAKAQEKVQQKASKEAERAASKMAKDSERAARAKENAEKRAQTEAQRTAHKTQVTQERIARKLAQAQEREKREIAKAMLGPKYDPAARAQQQMRLQAQAAKRNASFQKENEKYTKGQQRLDAKATSFGAREAQRSRAQAERVAMAELRARQRADAAAVRSAQVAARQRSAAELREIRKVEAERNRAARTESRRQRELARQQANARKEHSDFIARAGASMFGPGLGGILAAFQKSPQAAGQLAALSLLEAGLEGVKRAASAAFDAIKSLIQKTYEVSSRFEISIRSISNTLQAMRVSPGFLTSTKKANDLYEQLRVLAAVLPGETQDYVDVFKLGLPMALAQGERDLKRFADVSAKFTAFAIESGQLNMQQTGRDLARILQGRALATTAMYRKLQTMPALNLMEAKDWNKLLPVERMKLFYEAIEQASTGFEDMRHSADAILGTFNSLIDMIFFQRGGSPLFQSTLRIVERINKILQDNNNEITKSVSQINQSLGWALEGAALKISGWVTSAISFVAELRTADSIIARMARAAYSLSKAVGGGPVTWAYDFYTESEQAGKQAAEATERQRAIEKRTQADAAIEKAGTHGESLLLGAAAAAGLPADQQAEAFERLSKSEAARKAGGRAFEAALSVYGKLPTDRVQELWDMGDRHLRVRTSEDGDIDEGKGHKTRGAPKQRASTINDFRFSKFDIRQEFAEGFDPDRIAVAFASDLAKLGEMRMQSAYAPLYSVMGG